MSTDGSALGYTELLRLALAKGLQELDISIVQVPADSNRGHAVVLATARVSGGVYRAVGEAWWDEAPGSVRSQALVLAESRAKTRALCEAVAMPQPVAEAPRTTGSAQRAAPRQGMELVPAAPEDMPTDGNAVGSAIPESQPGATPAVSRALPKPAPRSSFVPAEGLGPDVLQKLLQMTRRVGELKHEELTEEEALAKLDSFFLRAFNHPLSEGTRVEGQRVVQRLASDLARLSQESNHDVAS